MRKNEKKEKKICLLQDQIAYIGKVYELMVHKVKEKKMMKNKN